MIIKYTALILIFLFVSNCYPKQENKFLDNENSVEIKKTKLYPTKSTNNRGMVWVSSLALRTQPNTKGNLVKYLQEGQIVEISKVSDSLVEIDNIKDYWIFINTIKSVKDSEKFSGWVFGGFVIDYNQENIDIVYKYILDHELLGIQRLEEEKNQQIIKNQVLNKQFKFNFIRAKCLSEGDKIEYSIQFNNDLSFDYKELHELYEFRKEETYGKGNFSILDNKIVLSFHKLKSKIFKFNSDTNSFNEKHENENKLDPTEKKYLYFSKLDLILPDINNNYFLDTDLKQIGLGDDIINSKLCDLYQLEDWKISKGETFNFYFK